MDKVQIEREQLKVLLLLAEATTDGSLEHPEHWQAIAAAHVAVHGLTFDPSDTLHRVRTALKNSGYGDDEIDGAEFVKLNGEGTEVHSICYHDPDEDDGEGTGFVYIRDHDGVLKGEY